MMGRQGIALSLQEACEIIDACGRCHGERLSLQGIVTGAWVGSFGN